MDTTTHHSKTHDEGLLGRIRGEFLEMPGLRLTSAQAQRLWSVDAQTCADLLDALIEREFLARFADGRYGRASDGSAARPPRRMVKADLDFRTDNRVRTPIRNR